MLYEPRSRHPPALKGRDSVALFTPLRLIGGCRASGMAFGLCPDSALPARSGLRVDDHCAPKDHAVDGERDQGPCLEVADQKANREKRRYRC